MIPPYLRFLCSLGCKYAPHGDPKRCAKRLTQMVSTEIPDLERVLLWQAWHEKLQSPDLLTYLPHKSLFPKSGARPSQKILEELGATADAIKTAVEGLSIDLKLRVMQWEQDPKPRRGIRLNHKLLQTTLTPPHLKEEREKEKEREEEEDPLIGVSSDKGGDILFMNISTYLKQAEMLMKKIHFEGTPIYRKLEGSKASWTEKMSLAAEAIRNLVMAVCPPNLVKIMDNFLQRQPEAQVGKFHMLAKTHKPGFPRWCGPEGWPARPIVTLGRASGRTASILLSAVGKAILKIDRIRSPRSTPLKDTTDAVARLQATRSRLRSEDILGSSWDFDDLYTSLLLSDLTQALRYWIPVTLQATEGKNHLAEGERALLKMMMEEIPQEQLTTVMEYCTHLMAQEKHKPQEGWDEIEALIQEMEQEEDIFTSTKEEIQEAVKRRPWRLGEFLMSFTMHSVVFENPGVGMYQQNTGVAMGTHMAPHWANLVLRYYEKKAEEDHPQMKDITVMRSMDDVLVLYPAKLSTFVDFMPKLLYPEHLTVTWSAKHSRGNLSFLDLQLMDIEKGIYSPYWKPAHGCEYVPWHSNHPRQVKLGWVRGESIRLIRLSSHKIVYHVALERLKKALIRWRYPEEALKKIVPWEDKVKFTRARGPLERAGEELVGNPSPKEVCLPVHVIRLPYDHSVQIQTKESMAKVVGHQGIPPCRLHTVFKGALTMKKLWLQDLRRQCLKKEAQGHKPPKELQQKVSHLRPQEEEERSQGKGRNEKRRKEDQEDKIRKNKKARNQKPQEEDRGGKKRDREKVREEEEEEREERVSHQVRKAQRAQEKDTQGQAKTREGAGKAELWRSMKFLQLEQRAQPRKAMAAICEDPQNILDQVQVHSHREQLLNDQEPKRQRSKDQPKRQKSQMSISESCNPRTKGPGEEVEIHRDTANFQNEYR